MTHEDNKLVAVEITTNLCYVLNNCFFNNHEYLSQVKKKLSNVLVRQLNINGADLLLQKLENKILEY